MPRNPSHDDLAALRQLLANAGSKRTLRRWIDDLPSTGKRGRPKANDDIWLAGIELVCRTAVRERPEIKRFELLKTIVLPTLGLAGKNPEVIARRIANALRARKFTDQELFEILKVSDPSKVIFWETGNQ